MDVRTNCIIVGAQKAATSTLFNLLAQSKAIAAAHPKEPHFFSTFDDWRGRLDQYHRIYGAQSRAIRCEASTSYTFFPHRRPEIWKDLHEYNPALKIIYVVRDPIDRIVSHYRHSVRRGYTRQSIRDFVLHYPLAMAICRYHTQIIPYVESFGRDQVLLLEFDEVVRDQHRCMMKVAGFLGLAADTFAAAAPVHANPSAEIQHHRLLFAGPLGRALDRLIGRRRAERATVQLPYDLARTVQEQLEPEIAGLEKLMDRDLGSWRPS